MPELPEVETVRRGLAPVLEGARLRKVRANRADLRFPLPKDFAGRLEGVRIEALNRRAKYLLAALETGETLVCHLGMSGRFDVAGARAALDARYHARTTDPVHTHVVFETDRGARVEYNDPRRFGFMELIPTPELDRHPWFRDLGPEPLGNAFGAETLASAFSERRQPVKLALLDQKVVAGLGNIYVCEALHRARISPKRAAGRIGRERLETLAQIIRDVLNEAIAAGGSSLRDFANAEGALGYFQHSFRVYDREGEPCDQCGGVIARLAQGGRSTFYCRRCQR